MCNKSILCIEIIQYIIWQINVKMFMKQLEDLKSNKFTNRCKL